LAGCAIELAALAIGAVTAPVLAAYSARCEYGKGRPAH
jgi:hypothetical protein